MITHIVGNRPQFIKLAPVYAELKNRGYEQSIIHSGQHYDKNMSDVFFEELGLPAPDVNLGVGSGSHAEMTGRAMVGVEKTLTDMNPELVILYGDTDTTLAAAIATKKLNIPIAHVEGGIRTYNKTNPEEANRVLTDHISDIIFCPTKASVVDGEKEGLGDRLVYSGDVMYDTYLMVSGRQGNTGTSEDIVLMTWHRAENTSTKERMSAILDLVEKMPYKVVCPLHPRTVKCLQNFELWDRAVSIRNFAIEEPVGYFQMVKYMNQARIILTDSGGLSKESSFAGIKCLFMVDIDVWRELMDIDWIHKFDPESEQDVIKAIEIANRAERVELDKRPMFYGNGKAAAIIADEIVTAGKNG